MECGKFVSTAESLYKLNVFFIKRLNTLKTAPLTSDGMRNAVSMILDEARVIADDKECGEDNVFTMARLLHDLEAEKHFRERVDIELKEAQTVNKNLLKRLEVTVGS